MGETRVKPSKELQLWPLLRALLVVLIAAWLYVTAGTVYREYRRLENDRVAESDYRKLKTAVFNAVNDRQGPARFVYAGHEGPYVYSGPLQGTALSPSVRAAVLHQIVRRQNQRPISVTRVEVYHAGGRRRYRFSEANGKVVEQVVGVAQP